MITADQWFYRLEGNNNVVFTDINNMRVLRLPKVRKRRQDRKAVPQRVDLAQEIEYLEHVAYKILKNLRVRYKGEKVYLSKEFIKQLSKKMAGKRPHYFQDEGLDETTEYGLLFPNFCKLLSGSSTNVNQSAFLTMKPYFTPTISIELRPKSCYYPVGMELCSEIKDNCYFCLLRVYMKLTRPEVLQTKYCPNDLYSGNRARVKRAIRDLISCPQRYFSVRIDDQNAFSNVILADKHADTKCTGSKKRFNRQVFDQNVSCHLGENGREAFQNLLCDALQASVVNSHKDLSSSFAQLPSAKPHCRRNSSKEDALSSVDASNDSHNSSILAFLSSVDAMRYFPLPSLVKMHRKVKSHLEEHQEDADVLSLDSPYNVPSWENAIKILSTSGTNYASKDLPSSVEPEPEVMEAAEMLRQFIIARSFSCCSLIITLQQIEQEISSECELDVCDAVIVSDGFGRYFKSSISIIDMDKDLPKSIEKNCRRQIEILTYLNNYFSSG